MDKALRTPYSYVILIGDGDDLLVILRKNFVFAKIAIGKRRQGKCLIK